MFLRLFPVNHSRSHLVRAFQSEKRFTRSVHARRIVPARSKRGVLFGCVALGGLSPFLLSQVHNDAEFTEQSMAVSSETTFGTLLRSWLVYTMCSFPSLVDASPGVLETLSKVPIVRQITEAVVRVTFFDQFVGGDTALRTISLVRRLRTGNKGTLFAYSVEVDESEATSSSSQTKKADPPVHKRIVNEMIHCVDVAADFEDSIIGPNTVVGRRTWVAIKMTALVPNAQALINLSRHIIDIQPRSQPRVPFPGCPHLSDLDVLYKEKPAPSLSREDISSLRELHEDLIRICQRAQERGVKIIIDAEYSWYQPAIDALQLSLMKRFNKLEDANGVQPLVYGTFQAYLRRTPLHLAQSLKDAKSNGYALGVKLVRGAYHPHEVEAYNRKAAGKPSLSVSPEDEPPVWLSKDETDRCYNSCARMLIGEIKKDIEARERVGRSSYRGVLSWFGTEKIPGSMSRGGQTLGVLFGTHNWESCRLILNELVVQGLATREGGALHLGEELTERLTMGQLYGMSDALTDHLVQNTKANGPVIIKYIPYGALSETMPYLGRRAIENKSVLGNGVAEYERRRAGAEIRRRVSRFFLLS